MEPKFYTLSPRERDVLSTIREGFRTRNEIADKTGITAPHLSRILKKLKMMGLISYENNTVDVLFKGEMYSLFYETFSKYERVFELIDLDSYILEDIPEGLRYRMYELSNVVVIESDRDILQPHPVVIENIAKSKYVVGYGKMLYPEYAKIFLDLAKRGVATTAIINRRTLGEIEKVYRSELKEFLDCRNSKLLVSERNFNFSVILTDSAFFMSFFFKNGTLDYTKFYAWYDGQGKKWGEDLIDHIKKYSCEV